MIGYYKFRNPKNVFAVLKQLFLKVLFVPDYKHHEFIVSSSAWLLVDPSSWYHEYIKLDLLKNYSLETVHK